MISDVLTGLKTYLITYKNYSDVVFENYEKDNDTDLPFGEVLILDTNYPVSYDGPYSTTSLTMYLYYPITSGGDYIEREIIKDNIQQMFRSEEFLRYMEGYTPSFGNFINLALNSQKNETDAGVFTDTIKVTVSIDLLVNT